MVSCEIDWGIRVPRVLVTRRGHLTLFVFVSWTKDQGPTVRTYETTECAFQLCTFCVLCSLQIHENIIKILFLKEKGK